MLAFLLLLTFSLFFSACSCGVKVDDKESSSSDTSTITSSSSVTTIVIYESNSTTNKMTNQSIMSNLAGWQFLERSVPIQSLRNKMFVWLDASLTNFLSLNAAGKLTNWINRNDYTIQTNFITNSITTNITTNITITTNTTAINNNTNTNINTVTTTILDTITSSITLSYELASSLSATPKSDVSANENVGLVVSNTVQGSNNYVLVDYEGDDRVGFKIDTSSLADSQQVAAFYLVTEWVQGNNVWHVPLGYDNLGHQKRFLTKKHHEQIYLAVDRNESKAGLTLNEEDRAREKDFSIPNTLHLLSATNLGISKSALNNILGAFPQQGGLGGGQKVRELLIFTNDLTALDHSNMVRYLVEKWHLPRQTLLITNLSSYYGHKDSYVIENAIDNNQTTTFYLNNAPQNAVSNRLLFQFKLNGSVLAPSALLSASRGVSTGESRLVLRTGNKSATDTLKAPVKVELLRKADVLAGNNSWYTLTNVAADNNNGVKTLIFNLLDASNDFIGYRLVATGNVNTPNWLQIDDFVPSRTSLSSPRVTSLANTLPGGKIYNTNYTLFSNVFTNTLTFDQDVYGLAASDFQVSNGVLHSLTPTSARNYTLVIKPFSFQSNSVGQSLFLKITLSEAAVTNASGGINHAYGKSIAFTIFNPFNNSAFDVGNYSTPTFDDFDSDGDLDMVSGELWGGFLFYSNTGTGSYVKYDKNNAANPFSGAAFDVGTYSKPTSFDLDGDGDVDMVSGERHGRFWFYSNKGNNNYTVYNQDNVLNPFSGLVFDTGDYSRSTLFDIDGDGDVDMVSGERWGRFWFYSNKGNDYQWSSNYNIWNYNNTNNPFSSEDIGEYSTPALGDLDGDGDVDMVSGERHGRFWFYSNTGTGSYVEYDKNNAANPFSGAAFDVGDQSSPALADIDGDGDLDMVSGNYNGGFVYFMNVGGIFVRVE